jgi:hypothetical protein
MFDWWRMEPGGGSRGPTEYPNMSAKFSICHSCEGVVRLTLFSRRRKSKNTNCFNVLWKIK